MAGVLLRTFSLSGTPPNKDPKCFVALEWGWDESNRHRPGPFSQGEPVMIVSNPVTYAIVTQAAAATVKSVRGEFYGVLVNSSSSGTVTIRDGGSGGTTVFVSGTVTAGQVITFGGVGVLCKTDIHVTVGGTANVTILYV